MALSPKDFICFIHITEMRSGWSFKQQGSRVRVTDANGDFVTTISTPELQASREKILNEDELRAAAMTYIESLEQERAASRNINEVTQYGNED